jgi:hypothetical protein
MSFIAYGITIESDVLVSNLPLGEKEPEVVVRFAQLDKPVCEIDAARRLDVKLGEFRVYWRGVGTYYIRQGREILIAPDPGVEEAVIKLFLLGPALAYLLHQRGRLVLHASVVRINGIAVGFLGEKGWGKSTTAAALNARGHALVADDLLVIELGPDGIPMVHPGPPNFKLWPEAAAATFGDDPSALARLHSRVEKRTRSASTAFLDEPLPLGHVYVLDRGAMLESVPMKPVEALLALVRHSYFSGLMKSLGALDENFRQCVQLTRQISCRFLKRPSDLHGLRDIASLVEEEMAQHPQAVHTSALTTAQ